MKQVFYTIYVWLIAIPILLIVTVIVALLTILLSPLFPDKETSYFPARFWGRCICFLLFVRVEISGIEHINPKESYIFALNHQSFFDIFVVYGWLPNIFKWIMKTELRKIPFVGLACQVAGHIFIDRSSHMAAIKSIEKAEEQLRNGVSVVIFPEGTRTSTGKMRPFKRGVFRIATDLALPIVPATLVGSFECLKRGTLRFTPGKIQLHIHQPINVKQYLPDNIQGLMNDTWMVINNAMIEN